MKCIRNDCTRIDVSANMLPCIGDRCGFIRAQDIEWEENREDTTTVRWSKQEM